MPYNIAIQELSVRAIMDRWPVTVRVFLDHRLRCIGCPMSRFQTLADAAREHGQHEADLLAALEAVIGSEQARDLAVSDQQ